MLNNRRVKYDDIYFIVSARLVVSLLKRVIYQTILINYLYRQTFLIELYLCGLLQMFSTSLIILLCVFTYTCSSIQARKICSICVLVSLLVSPLFYFLVDIQIYMSLSKSNIEIRHVHCTLCTCSVKIKHVPKIFSPINQHSMRQSCN